MLFDVKHSWILIWNLNKAQVLLHGIYHTMLSMLCGVYFPGPAIRNSSGFFWQSAELWQEETAHWERPISVTCFLASQISFLSGDICQGYLNSHVRSQVEEWEREKNPKSISKPCDPKNAIYRYCTCFNIGALLMRGRQRENVYSVTSPEKLDLSWTMGSFHPLLLLGTVNWMWHWIRGFLY